MKKILCVIMVALLVLGLAACADSNDTVDKLCSALQNGNDIEYLSLLDLDNYSKYLYAYYAPDGAINEEVQEQIDERIDSASDTKNFIRGCDELAYAYDEDYTVTHSTIFDDPDSDAELLESLKDFDFSSISEPNAMDTFCRDFIKGLKQIRTVETYVIIRSTKNTESKNRTYVTMTLYNYNGFWYIDSMDGMGLDNPGILYSVKNHIASDSNDIIDDDNIIDADIILEKD